MEAVGQPRCSTISNGDRHFLIGIAQFPYCEVFSGDVKVQWGVIPGVCVCVFVCGVLCAGACHTRMFVCWILCALVCVLM